MLHSAAVNSQLKKLLQALAVVALIYAGNYLNSLTDGPASGPAASRPSAPPVAPANEADALLAEAFAERRSDVLVTGSGRVARLLSDDTKGSQHQRFIIELGTGQTVLVAHNIDLAPRVDALRRGDTIEFSGEYEWNPDGGVVHWTHHDPAGRHPGGWLRHNGRIYE